VIARVDSKAFEGDLKFYLAHSEEQSDLFFHASACSQEGRRNDAVERHRIQTPSKGKLNVDRETWKSRRTNNKDMFPKARSKGSSSPSQ